MNKNRILIISIAIIICIFIGCIVFYNPFLNQAKISSKNNSQFPPSNTLCFDSFTNALNNGYADGFRIPAFNFRDVSHFRCASRLGFDQYEIRATDKEGHSFYIHKDGGGMAASGADTVYNFCYKKDNNIIRNEKLSGRESTKEIGTCFWTDNFPSNPTSEYEFNHN